MITIWLGIRWPCIVSELNCWIILTRLYETSIMNVWFWQLLFKKWSQSSIHLLSGLLRTNMTTSFQLACLPIIVSQLINILSLCNIWKLKSTNIYAWPCGLIVIMANVWRVGPGIERCRFEFWQRLSSILPGSWM